MKTYACLWLIALLATSLLLAGCAQEKSQASRSGNRVESSLEESKGSGRVTSSAESTSSPPSSTTAPTTTRKAGNLVDVVSVTDGDTIKVRIDSTDYTIRLIGIDTPETRDPRKPVQCFGREASNKMKELVENKQVILESDATQGDTDKYGRLLRFVFLSDGTNVNLTMIAQGFAHEYTYNLPYKYQSEFKQAESDARNGGKGLWSASTCAGDTTQAADASGAGNASAATSQSNNATSAGVVKKSNSGICHAPGTTYYDQTKNFTPYNSTDECLASGGRLPKR